MGFRAPGGVYILELPYAATAPEDAWLRNLSSKSFASHRAEAAQLRFLKFSHVLRVGAFMGDRVSNVALLHRCTLTAGVVYVLVHRHDISSVRSALLRRTY